VGSEFERARASPRASFDGAAAAAVDVADAPAHAATARVTESKQASERAAVRVRGVERRLKR